MKRKENSTNLTTKKCTLNSTIWRQIFTS